MDHKITIGMSMFVWSRALNCGRIIEVHFYNQVHFGYQDVVRSMLIIEFFKVTDYRRTWWYKDEADASQSLVALTGRVTKAPPPPARLVFPTEDVTPQLLVPKIPAVCPELSTVVALPTQQGRRKSRVTQVIQASRSQEEWLFGE